MQKSLFLNAPEYETIAKRVRDILHREFGSDAKINTDRGFGGRVCVQIVSFRIDPMTERQKKEYVWQILQDELGSDAMHITFILAYGTDEQVVSPFG